MIMLAKGNTFMSKSTSELAQLLLRHFFLKQNSNKRVAGNTSANATSLHAY